jgi:hypothetical protein
MTRCLTRCKDCKFYNVVAPYACSCPKMFYGYQDQDALDSVRIESDGGWGMHPGPEFGCVHGEPK